MYPMLEINLRKIYENTKVIVKLCEKMNISVSGVVKGSNADSKVIEQFINGGCKIIASSRMRQIKYIKNNYQDIENMLIRLPMNNEIEELVQHVDISLNSEKDTIDEIEYECKKQNKTHKVILMMDLGDLREGIIDEEEFINLSLYIENRLEKVKLYGVGTNLSCYGSVKPTVRNLSKLCDIATIIEDKINRKLDIISGGATTTIPLILSNQIPKKVNNLRIGEAILLGRDLEHYWKCNINLNKDTFILKTKIIEIKKKPSHPMGELFIDCFGNENTYLDKGIRKRAILAAGKQDFVFHSDLIPIDKEIEIVGSSSDHLIIDIQQCKKEYKVGDIVEFEMFYAPMLYLTESPDVEKKYV